MAPVGQLFRPFVTQQQALAFHRREVFAIDPDEIDGSGFMAPGGLFRHHLGNRIGRVVQLHVNERDAVTLLDLLAGPFDIGVDIFCPAPGVEIDRFAARALKHRIPVGGVGVFRQGGHREPRGN